MKRPSHGTVVAYIALFIALGGTTFAATQLGKNSVGSKQLKKNAVTTAKIKKEAVTAAKVKKGTLTGAQINSSTLGTVPSAQTAQTASRAQTANALAEPEPWHVVGTPGEPQFQNGCKAAKPVGFYKDQVDVVHLEGNYQECSAKGDVAFQLPPGFRPGQLQQFPLIGSTEAAVAVEGTEGVPTQLQGTVGCGVALCFLDGITFRAES